MIGPYLYKESNRNGTYFTDGIPTANGADRQALAESEHGLGLTASRWWWAIRIPGSARQGPQAPSQRALRALACRLLVDGRSRHVGRWGSEQAHVRRSRLPTRGAPGRVHQFVAEVLRKV